MISVNIVERGDEVVLSFKGRWDFLLKFVCVLGFSTGLSVVVVQ